MRISLSGSAYAARSHVAAAQRCLNLYSEPAPGREGEPASTATYPTPGLRLLATLPQGPVRAIRAATNGNVYVVAGSGVYAVDPAWNATLIGSITADLATPVSLADNGLQMVIVDGTPAGWKVTLADNTFASIVDGTGSFRGADRADYLDTFLLFNVPGTPQFQSSLSLSTTFDPLYFANKESYSDLLVSLIVARRQIWLIGSQTTEVWYDTGAADFPFQSMQGVFVDHGCCAKYSVAQTDNAVFWLSQDRQGQGLVLKGTGLSAERVSTFAIEAEISCYATIADAIGYTYQLQGHSFYVLAFPSADKTWAFDISTGLWCELAWIDGNGDEHRHRGNCSFLAHGTVVVGDWENGNLYALDPAMFTDFGGPIKRIRSFPHIEGKDGNRLSHGQFLANCSVGNLAGTTGATAPMIFLSWSDDRGLSFGNPVGASLGAAGEYKTSVQFQRLGLARSRVYRLETSAPLDIAILGAFLDVSEALS